jgi:hypothetical protein
MTPDWRPITDASDPEYSAISPRYDAPWYGSEQLDGAASGASAISIGPDGSNDGRLRWTFSVSTNAPAGKFPGNRRYLAVPI